METRFEDDGPAIYLDQDDKRLTGIHVTRITREVAAVLRPGIEAELLQIQGGSRAINDRLFEDPEPSDLHVQAISPRGVALYGLGQEINCVFYQER